MIEIPVYNLEGKQTSKMRIDEADLGGELRPALLKQAYVMYHANRRQGSAHTRGRSEVAGSTRKIHRQKGTGNARMGTVRTNIRRGGGVTFGKKPRDLGHSMPTKMRRLATRNALLAKAVDNEIKVVESFDFDAPKTSRFAKIAAALGIDRTCLLAVAEGDHHTFLSARNMKDMTPIRIDQLNAYDLLSRRFFLVEKAALKGWLGNQKKGASRTRAEAA